MSTGDLVLVAVNLAWIVPFIVIMAKKGAAARKDRDHRRMLLETGHAAPAVVLKVTEVGPWYGKVPHLAFELRVEPEGEPPFPSSAKGFFRQIDYPRLQPGSRVEVRYAPADRARCAVHGDRLI